MGQRQDKDEIVYGDDCEGCTPELWPDGKTPKYIYARFIGIKTCPDDWCDTQPPPPNDHTFRLTQKETKPCQWQYKSNQWWIEYYADDPIHHRSFLVLRSLLPVYYYLIFSSLTDDDTPCQDFFANQLRCGDIYNCGHKGIAVVTWQLETIKILKSLNMKGMSDIFMEMRPLVDANRVYKFCRLQDATNIAIEYEPEKAYRVTGTLTPDATGYYYKHLLHNGKMSYRRTDGTYFIWWDGVERWVINTGLEAPFPPAWQRVDPNPIGEYQPIEPWTGVATVTKI